MKTRIQSQHVEQKIYWQIHSMAEPPSFLPHYPPQLPPSILTQAGKGFGWTLDGILNLNMI